jgi:short-subunit dehydrogenase
MLSECLRYELAAQGIPVVCVKPGPVQTPICGKSRSKSEAVLQDLPPEAQELYGETLDKVGFRCRIQLLTVVDVCALQ